MLKAFGTHPFFMFCCFYAELYTVEELFKQLIDQIAQQSK